MRPSQNSTTFSLKYAQAAFYALLCYLPFSGTAIILLGNHSFLSLGRDIFYLIALGGVIQLCRQKKQSIILPQAIKAPLGLVFFLGMLTIALTNLPDQIQGVGGAFPLIMGFWGLKVLLGYVPLIACTYHLVRTEKDFYFLMRLQVVLVLIACALGAIQILLLQTGICAGTQGEGEALFRALLDSRCFVGGSLLYAPDVGGTRLPGTFVSPWRWGWFLISGIFFSFCTAFRDKELLWRLLGLAAMVSAVTLLIASGQTATPVLILPSVMFLIAVTRQITDLKQFILIGLLLAVLLLYLTEGPSVISISGMKTLFSQWWQFSPYDFLQTQFSYVWANQAGILGHGVGRATNSARVYGETILLETYYPKLLYELGPIGLGATLLMYTTVIVTTFKAYRATTNRRLRAYGASMWSFVLMVAISPFYYPLDTEPVNIYFWVAVGLTLKAAQLSEVSISEMSMSEMSKTSDRRIKR